MTTRRSILAAAASMALLAGCVSTPDFQMSPEQQNLIPSSWHGPNPLHADPVAIAAWWQSWNDEGLLLLINRAQSHNTDVKTARANLRYAMAQLKVANAGFFPDIDGRGSGGRNHRAGFGSNTFGIGLNGSWTIDAGGTYAAYQAAEADYESQLASLADIQVAISAQVAIAYVNLKLSEKLLQVAKQNLVTQKEALSIADWRFSSGLVDSTDVDQAKTSYEQTRSSIPLHQFSIQQYRNVLAKLTSQKPEEVQVPTGSAIPQAPENLALSIPGDVIRHRPSVRAAEANVMAAMARHTQARAALYPSLSITGSFGLSGLTISSLGESGTHQSSILGAISLPIFNAGALRARVEAQDERVKAANAAYEASLLVAITDVEDALNQIWAYQNRSNSLKTALRSARNAATNARQNYRAGLQDFTVVLTTQRSLLSVEESLANAQAEIAKSYIRLYQALGGGWSPAEKEKTS